MDISYYKKYEPIFGEWKIIREIGEGSFGKVFEIEREDFGYTYKAALKAITIPQSESELDSILDSGMDMGSATTYCRGIVKELNEEFRLMSKLKGNSNVVSYEDHKIIEHNDEIGWDILIRMELLTPLMRYSRNNPLDRNNVVQLGIDICKALELCRIHNIVHRDIKPENIFVSDNGQFKLGDFGIAKTMEQTTGSIGKKGTYSYMAPEVYKGEPYGPRVDLYSLGIVLYRYMNNGRLPFQPPAPAPLKASDNERSISRRINGDTIPAPANADQALAEVILKACAYSPEDRYASPTEMRVALENLVEKPAVSAPVVEKKADDISEAETEADRTVSLFGAVGIKEVVEDVANTEEEIIENASEAEKVCEVEEELDKTASASDSVETEAPVETANENIVEQEAKKEPARAEIEENKQVDSEKRQKPEKKTAPIMGIVAVVLAILAIVYFKLQSGRTDNAAVPAGSNYVENADSRSVPIAHGPVEFDNGTRIEFGNLQIPYNIGHDSNNIVFCDLGDENAGWYLNEVSDCTYQICTTESYDVMLDIENAAMETGNTVQLCEYTGYEVQNWKFESVEYEDGSVATFIISAEQGYGEFCLALCDGNLVIKPLDYTDTACMWGLSY